MDPAAPEVADRVRRIAREVAAPEAATNDREGRFPRAAVTALGRAGLLGLPVAAEDGGLGLGPRAFADATAELAAADGSLAMVYVMHVAAALCVAHAPPNAPRREILGAMARGEHLSTLAFSERGSRSHFWAPVSRARPNGTGVFLSATKSFVTSAGEADSYVVITQSPRAKSPVESTLYLVASRSPGVRVAGRWDGMGLRGNASAPVTLEDVHAPDTDRLTAEGGAFETLLSTVLPWFNLGVGAMSLGICRAATGATAEHLRTSRLEHLDQSLAEAYPTLRARLARMQIQTDLLAAHIDRTVRLLESPTDETVRAVLEVKAVGNETAIAVTGEAMRACGGAAYSRQTSIDRYFRDAQAGSVMAPTVDQLQEFLGRTMVGLPPFA